MTRIVESALLIGLGIRRASQGDVVSEAGRSAEVFERNHDANGSRSVGSACDAGATPGSGSLSGPGAAA